MYYGPLIVNLDLVIPAIIKSELQIAKKIQKKDRNYSNVYFTISPRHIMSFAIWIKTLHLGRVVINFTEDDALKYLRNNSDVYEEIDNSQVFQIKFSKYTEENINKYIDKLALNINYDEEVMKFFELCS